MVLSFHDFEYFHFIEEDQQTIAGEMKPNAYLMLLQQFQDLGSAIQQNNSKSIVWLYCSSVSIVVLHCAFNCKDMIVLQQ